MNAPAPQRRVADQRIETLVADVEVLKKEMRANTEVTTQVRDILTSFKTLGKLAAWVTVVMGALGATFAAIKTGLNLHDGR